MEPQASMLTPRQSARRSWFLDPRLALARRLARRIAVGKLTVTTPGGERIVAEGAPGEEATLHLHNWRAMTRVLTGSDIGFAQAVIDGDCSSPDMVALVRLFDRNMAALGGAATNYGAARLWQKLAHARRANNPRRLQPQHPRPLRPRQRLLRLLARPYDELFLGSFCRRRHA